VIDNWDTTGMSAPAAATTPSPTCSCRRSATLSSTPCSTTTARTPSGHVMRYMPVCATGCGPAALDHVRDLASHQALSQRDAWADTGGSDGSSRVRGRLHRHPARRARHPHAAGRSVGRTTETLDDLTVDERAALPLCPGCTRSAPRGRSSPASTTAADRVDPRASPMDRLAAGHHDECQHLFAQSGSCSPAAPHLLAAPPTSGCAWAS